MPDRSQKPALVLHIGFPKCGSTSIQSAMIRNQKMLRTRGIVIVDQTFRHPGQGQAKAVAQVELGQILAEADPSEKIAEGLAAISASAIAHGDRVCVISSESLGNAKEFAPLFQPAVELFSDITVLAYVRPQHEWLPSAWKQFGLKAGRTLEDYIAEGMAQRLPNFLNRIERWKEDIEGCQVSVGALRRPALKDGDLITDAFSRLVLGILPAYVAEGKRYLTIAVGCTGGKHRSVVIANEIAAQLEKNDYFVNVFHRDIHLE